MKGSWRARRSAPTLIATSLKLGPGAALAHQRVRASGAEARTRKPRPCKGRDGQDQLCIRRVIGPRRGELLRALKSQGGAGPVAIAAGLKEDGRVGARLAPSPWQCKARERAALLVKAQARAAVGLAGGVLMVVVVVHAA